MAANPLSQPGIPNAGHLATSIIGVALLYIVLKPVYNVFLHPLRTFPGPLLWRLSPIPRAWALCTGTLIFKIAKHHEKYGKVVRIGPDELAFSDVEAWKDIYGHRAAGEQENPKDILWYRISKKAPPSVISADRKEHGVLRRQLAHGFSERSMQAQESIIGGYVDLLMQRLHENAGKVPLNMREWYNWTTFDIIGNLGFGSDFELLKNSSYTPWVRMINDAVKSAAVLQGMGYVGLGAVSGAIMDLAIKGLSGHRELTDRKLRQRIELAKTMERRDLIEGLLHKGIPFEELSANASLLIVAGSETTATLLSGATFFLTSDPVVLQKLTKEVRSAFTSKEEITLRSIQSLPYMLACLNESLRKYPPVAVGLPRRAPPGGASIAGTLVPEGTIMCVWQWAMNHDADYWVDPWGFHPERWTGEEPQFANDCQDAMQPFSIGPRNCIGRNLAYAEMRLILTRILFDFDLKLADHSKDWLANQKCYALWDKPALDVYLTPV